MCARIVRALDEPVGRERDAGGVGLAEGHEGGARSWRSVAGDEAEKQQAHRAEIYQTSPRETNSFVLRFLTDGGLAPIPQFEFLRGGCMPKSLLLADDSITIQKVVQITFASEDFQITAVDNGDAALEKIRASRPAIVLADVVMPGKTGYDICQVLKSDPDTRNIPVILLAGTFEPFDEGRAKQVGAEDFIVKPFETQALIDKVKRLTGDSTAGTVAAAPVAAKPASPFAPPAAASPIFAKPPPAAAPAMAPPVALTPPVAAPPPMAAPKPVAPASPFAGLGNIPPAKPAAPAAPVPAKDPFGMGSIFQPPKPAPAAAPKPAQAELPEIDGHRHRANAASTGRPARTATGSDGSSATPGRATTRGDERQRSATSRTGRRQRARESSKRSFGRIVPELAETIHSRRARALDSAKNLA